MTPTLQSTKNFRLISSLKSSLSSRNGTGLILFPTIKYATAKLSNLYSVVGNLPFLKTVHALSAMPLTSISCGMTVKSKTSCAARCANPYSLQLPKADSLRYMFLDVLTVITLSFIRKTVSISLFISALTPNALTI